MHVEIIELCKLSASDCENNTTIILTFFDFFLSSWEAYFFWLPFFSSIFTNYITPGVEM